MRCGSNTTARPPVASGAGSISTAHFRQRTAVAPGHVPKFGSISMAEDAPGRHKAFALQPVSPSHEHHISDIVSPVGVDRAPVHVAVAKPRRTLGSSPEGILLRDMLWRLRG